MLSHLVGDFILQTGWQAANKQHGLRDRRARGALLAHVTSYTLPFAPLLVCLADRLGAGVLWLAALVAGPQLVHDGGHLVEGLHDHVTRANPREHPAA